MTGSKAGNKFYDLTYKFLVFLCLLFFIFTLVSSLGYLDYSNTSALPIFAAAAIVMLLIIWAFRIKGIQLTGRQFLITLTLLALLLRLTWILTVNTEPFSDFRDMYYGALRAAGGDFSFGRDAYFVTWPYQLGFTMYESLIIGIFGKGTLMLKIFNTIFSTLTTILIYKTSSKIFNETAGRIAGIVSAIYLPFIMMCSVLTNQHLSVFLFHLGFYLLISRGFKDKYSWVYIGVILSLGDIIRPLGPVILLAVGIFFIIHYIIGGKDNNKIKLTGKFVGMLLIFYLVHYMISYMFIGIGVTEYTLSNRDPLWKFVAGLNQRTTGHWDKADWDYLAQFELGEDRKSEQRKLIEERTRDKGQLVDLMIKKAVLMWGKNDSSTQWSMNHINNPALKNQINSFERLQYVCIAILGIISLSGLFKAGADRGHILFILLILGYGAVHLIIEIQTRYRFDIMPSLIILQAPWLKIIQASLRSRFNKGT